MKRFRTDYHIHTHFSNDSKASPDDIVRNAVSAGLDEIALTDHCCLPYIRSGIFPPYQAENAMQSLLACKEKYKDTIRILYGIEVGQPTQMQEEAKQFLSRYPFEIILGSLHGITGETDFSLIDYENRTDSDLVRLWEIYLDEYIEHVRWGRDRFQIATHLLYPLRYFVKNKRDHLIRLRDYAREIDDIFRALIQCGIALEINTARVRSIDEINPSKELVARYAELGGKLISVGSDAHFPEDVGNLVADVYAFLPLLGIKEIVRVKNRTIYTEQII